MTHEDKIIDELATKYGKSYTVKSEPHDYIHEGLNSAEFLSHFKSDLRKALTTYRAQVLEAERRQRVEITPEMLDDKAIFLRPDPTN
jgi:hypothetical protein